MSDSSQPKAYVIPPLLADEDERLRALRGYDILDTAPEESFDHITRLTAQLLGCQMALVSLVDDKRQWFKSRWNLAATETTRDVSFCGHALPSEDGLLIIPDARKDLRFAGNPLVTGEPYIRFYAGAVLRSAEGQPLGTLCLLDPEVRQGLSQEHQQLLQSMARQVEALLELRRALVQASDERARHENTLTLTYTGHWSWDIVSDQATWDQRTYEILGLPEGSPIHRETFLQCVAPEDRSWVRVKLDSLFETNATFHERYRVLHPDGRRRWVRSIGQLRRDAQGRALELYGAVGNIDAEVRDEQERQQLLEELQLTMQTVGLGLVRMNPEDLSFRADPRSEELLGTNNLAFSLQFTQIINQFVLPEDQDQARSALAMAMVGEESEVAVRVKTAGPHEKWLHWKLGRFRRENRKEVFIAMHDITRRKTAELEQAKLLQELLRERTLNTQVRQLVQMVNWSWEIEDDVLEMGAELESLFGVNPRRLTTVEHYMGLVHPEDLASFRSHIQRALDTGETYQTEHRIRSGDQDWWVKAVGTVEFNEAGKAARLYGALTDITAVKEAETVRFKQLEWEETQKRVMGLGTLAANVGHELRTPLQGIQSQLELLELMVENGRYERVTGFSDKIRYHLKQSGQIMDGMLRLAKKDYFGHERTERVEVDLTKVVDSIYQLESFTARGCAIEWQAQLPEEPLWVLGVQVDLEKVVKNLLDNALKSFEGIDHPRVTISLRQERGQAVWVVADNGVGMDEEVLQRCLDPFFTTREVGAGTGMGLTFCYNVAMDLGGDLKVESATGAGASFRLFLPLAAAPAA
jgi:PAS domain S-box-containing protein